MNTTDKDREEARKILGNLTITVSASIGPFGKTKTIDFPQTDKVVESTAKIIARIRARAKAEALREAAERVEKYMDGNHPPHHYSVGVHNALMGYSAILADEPNKEE